MIVRTYECTDCNTIFEVSHDSGNDPIPDCPICSRVLEWKPQGFAITTNKSKAIDYTQKVVEEDFGLTNMRDNTREGDVAFIAPRKTAAELDAIGQRESEAGREVVKRMTEISPEHKKQVDNFFGGQAVTVGQNRIPAQQMIAMGKSGPGADVDPMAMFHRGVKEGHIPKMQTRVVARAGMDGKIIT